MATVYNTSIVRDGLVFYIDAANKKSYPGTGTTWTDLSTSGLNMTMQGTVTWNSGGYFTGWSTANYFSNAGAISTYLPQGDAPRTIIALVEQGTVSGYQHAVHYGPGGVLNETYGIATSGGVLSDHRWGTSNIGGATTIAGQKYILSTRHSNLYPGSRHFVNGTFTDVATITTAATAATTFRIGLRVNAVAESWAADGKIYAVMIYNRALTDAEILQNYNALRGRVAL